MCVCITPTLSDAEVCPLRKSAQDPPSLVLLSYMAGFSFQAPPTWG